LPPDADASACAVFGGTYILGSEGAPSDIVPSDGGVTLRIGAHPSPITAKHLLTPPGFLEKPEAVRTSAQLVAIVTAQPPVLRKEEGEEEDDDTAVLVFPPQEGPLVRALVMGEGTGSCPRGQWVVYLSADADAAADPKALLEPYLARVAPEGVAFIAAYLQHRPEPGEEEEEAEGGEHEAAPEGAESNDPAPFVPAGPVVALRPYAGPHTLTEGLDHEAREAARAFRAVCGNEFFPAAEEEGDDEE
jgi:hypothetical protein